LLLQVFYSIRSERQWVEQIDYNLLFRWFVGLGLDDAVWHPKDFVATAREMNVTPHVTKNEKGPRSNLDRGPRANLGMPSASAADGWSRKASVG